MFAGAVQGANMGEERQGRGRTEVSRIRIQSLNPSVWQDWQDWLLLPKCWCGNQVNLKYSYLSSNIFFLLICFVSSKGLFFLKSKIALFTFEIYFGSSSKPLSSIQTFCCHSCEIVNQPLKLCRRNDFGCMLKVVFLFLNTCFKIVSLPFCNCTVCIQYIE